MQKKKQNSVIGIGLIALDAILNGNPLTPPIFKAGGSCGNVTTILSFLNFKSQPIARLANNKATAKLVDDIKLWGVNTDLIFRESTGSTPIIIQRLKFKSDGTLVHRFEFKNPETGKYLPSYKPLLGASVVNVTQTVPKCDYFYFDRLSRSTVDLAKYYKQKGAVVFFEPSSIKNNNFNHIRECEGIIDVIKFSGERIANYNSLFPKGLAKVEIETIGSNGLNFRINSTNKHCDWQHLPSFKIESVIDTVGAGDWCTSGIILELSKTDKPLNKITKKEWKSILNRGQAFGAVSCLFIGARGLMYHMKFPTLNSLVEKLLKNKVLLTNELPKIETHSLTNNQHESITSLLETK